MGCFFVEASGTRWHVFCRNTMSYVEMVGYAKDLCRKSFFSSFLLGGVPHTCFVEAACSAAEPFYFRFDHHAATSASNRHISLTYFLALSVFKLHV